MKSKNKKLSLKFLKKIKDENKKNPDILLFIPIIKYQKLLVYVNLW
jgi:16S rRNA U1498 N3-methylase RsmE